MSSQVNSSCLAKYSLSFTNVNPHFSITLFDWLLDEK